MNTQVHAPSPVAQQAVAAQAPQTLQREAAGGVADLRPQALAQRQRQQMMESSPQIRQLKAQISLMNNAASPLVALAQGASVQRLAASGPVSSPIVQCMPITRRMHNLVVESGSIEELEYAMKSTSYSPELKEELRSRWYAEHGDVDMTGESIVEEGEITDEEEALAYDDTQTAGAEIALNNVGHAGDVYDRDIGGDSYAENAGIDLNTIQLKRTGGSMGGPKDYPSSNFGDFEDVFYILAGDGSIDFSEKPTKSRHTSYVPVGKRKKAPLKHASIQWSNPDKSGTKVNLSKHPNIAKLDTKDRPQHFGMADALYSKKMGWTTAKKTADMRAGKWTWHHLPTQYEMILVDMQAHALHGHNGGVYIW